MTAFLLTDTREIDIEITGVLDGDIHDLAVTICGPKGKRFKVPSDLAYFLAGDDLYRELDAHAAYRTREDAA